MKCEVCGSKDVSEVIDLGDQPLCDDLIPIGDKQTSQTYRLCIHFCRNCKTALQEVNVEKNVLFPSTYHYRARNTPSVLSGMKNLVETVEEEFFSLKGKKVLDIGCNDASLLNFFYEKGATTYGIDPTDAIQESEKWHVTMQDYFSPLTARKLQSSVGFPDVITFTNCFAHIAGMHELITALSCLMGPKTIVVIENHYLGSVLEKNQFDTFYHEHPRTYSAKSFEVIASLLGAKLLKVEKTSRYAGNIRAYISRNFDLIGTPTNIQEDNFFEMFATMSSFIERWTNQKFDEIAAFNKINGPLKGIAFPGRSSILVNQLNLTPNNLEATYEIKGSKKTGHYIPGTRIPIYPEADLLTSKDRPDTVLNLAWHIEEDVKANLSNYNYHPNLINIL